MVIISWILNHLYMIPAIIFAIGLLVFIHELGHFLLAKLVGIRVERFSLGYPPRLFGKKIGETDYCISLVPLGGYVKLSGMIDESMDEASIKGEPWEFMSKPIYQRFLVIFAGPVMNLLFPVLLFALFAYFVGLKSIIDKPIVGEVVAEMPAAQAGIKAGDHILRINGNELKTWQDIVENIRNTPENQPIEIIWRSGDQEFSKIITPQYDTQQKSAKIGIGYSTTTEQYGFVSAVEHGFVSTYIYTKLTLEALGQVITGERNFKESVAGPVRIFSEIGKSAKEGWQNYLGLIALISLNLGIFNLLPIPVLDGGHLLYLLIEAIIRRPIPTKTKLIIQQIGMAFLLILIVLVTYNDVIYSIFYSK
ncbi:RIP metalloprotease RseP [candidate division KSB1 bacterium]|nr:RIP metalloprotease RseP [candidate division KSB1 bacterium]